VYQSGYTNHMNW